MIKKKIVCIVSALCITSSLLTACADKLITTNRNNQNTVAGDSKTAAAEICLFEIDGNTYNLADDYHEVVGSLVKNGTVVFDASTLANYAADGYIETDSSKKLDAFSYDGTSIYATTSSTPRTPAEVPKYVYYDLRRNSFSSSDGIDEHTALDTIGSKPGFYPYHGFSLNSEAYIVIYFDDKLINIQDYDESPEQFASKFKNVAIQSRNFGINYATCGELVESSNNYYSEIAVTNALLDGWNRIMDGSVNKMYAIRYFASREGTSADILVYSMENVLRNHEN